MNEIEILREEIIKKFPSASADFDKPVVSTGDWFLDVRVADKHVVIEWKPGIGGFGASDVSDPSNCLFGGGADQVCQESEEVLEFLSKVFGGDPVSSS